MISTDRIIYDNTEIYIYIIYVTFYRISYCFSFMLFLLCAFILFGFIGVICLYFNYVALYSTLHIIFQDCVISCYSILCISYQNVLFQKTAVLAPHP